MNSKIVFVLLFSLTGIAIKAQQPADDAKQLAKKKELQQRVINAKRERVMKQQALLVQTTSKYNHKESEIYSRLNTEVIPVDFPVYKSEYSDEQYTILMNKWYNAHPTMMKSETNTNSQNK